MKKLKMFNLLLFSLLIGRGLNIFSLPVKAETGQDVSVKVTSSLRACKPGDNVEFTLTANNFTEDQPKLRVKLSFSSEFNNISYDFNENLYPQKIENYETDIYEFTFDGSNSENSVSLGTIYAKIADYVDSPIELYPNITAEIYSYTDSGDIAWLPCSVDLDSARVTVTPPEPEKPTEIPAVAVTLTESSLTLNTGDISTIYATIEPANSTDNVVWDSSVPLVATVENGTITAHKAGETTITARRGDVSASCLVTVLCKHEYEHIESTATCLSEGIAEHYRCSKCGELFDTEKKHTDLQQLKEEKTEHNYSDLTEEIAATCETDGIKAHYTCKSCGTLFDTNKEIIENGDLIIPMTGHKYGRWKTDETSHWQECTNPECGKTTDKQEHICDNVPCESKKFCQICNNEYGEIKKHRYVFYREVSATCETEGTKAHYFCPDCGKYFDTEKQEISKEKLTIDKLNHKIGTEWKTDETSHWQECERCKEKLNYGEHRAADTSCEHKSVCEVCKSEYGKPGEHRLSFISGKTETCEKDGIIAHFVCTKCDKIFDENKQEITKEDLIIKKTGHTPDGIWKDYGKYHRQSCLKCKEKLDISNHTGKAGCGEKAVCNICGAQYGEPAEHSFGILNKRIEPTCRSEGREAYYRCKECGKLFNENKDEISEKDLVIKKSNHNAGNNWQSDGVKHWRKCLNCNEILDVAEHHGGQRNCLSRGICADCNKTYGEKGEHIYGELSREKKATCETDGVKSHYTCGVCSKIFDENKKEISKENLIITKTGHRQSENWHSDEENHQYICTNEGCGKILERRAHNFDYGTVTKQPGYDENRTGKKMYRCRECGYEKTRIIPVLTYRKNYKIVNGASQTVTENSGETVSFRSNCGIEKFVRLEIDEKLVDPENYILKEGSTIVELKPEYLATLEVGKHGVSIVSQDGTADTTLRITPQPEEEEETEKTTTAKTNKTSTKTAKTTKKIKSPNTGDISRPVMAMMGAAMLLTYFALCIKREKSK